MNRFLAVVILLLLFAAGCASTGNDQTGDKPAAAEQAIVSPQEVQPVQTEQESMSANEKAQSPETVSEENNGWAEPVIEVPLPFIEPSILDENLGIETVPLPDISKIQPAHKNTEKQNQTDTTAEKIVGKAEENAKTPAAPPSVSKVPSGNASMENDRIASAGASARETYAETSESTVDESIEYDDRVLAAIGESIQISLPDHRWVFDRKLSDVQGIEFTDTQYLNTSKEFIFSSDRRGESTLVFTKQDLDAGSVDVTRVRVSVLNLDEKLAALEEQETGEPKGRTVSPEFSRELLRQELENGNSVGIERQLKLLNISLGKTPEEDATENESDELSDIDWKAVIEGAQRLNGSQFEQTAVETLMFLLEKVPNEKNLIAQVYFLLGAMYESPPLPRDEREAVLYYRKVMQIYPTNIYYFRAEERIKYLERHFLQIR